MQHKNKEIARNYYNFPIIFAYKNNFMYVYIILIYYII